MDRVIGIVLFVISSMICFVRAEFMGCPELWVNPLGSLNTNQAVGMWWELMRTDNYLVKEPHRCMVSHFYLTKDHFPNMKIGEIIVIDDFTSIEGQTMTPHNRMQSKLIMDANNSNKMHTSKHSQRGPLGFEVIGHDRHWTWILAYTCQNSKQGAVVLTREKAVSDEKLQDIVREVSKKIRYLDIPLQDMTYRNNTYCDDVDFPNFFLNGLPVSPLPPYV